MCEELKEKCTKRIALNNNAHRSLDANVVLKLNTSLQRKKAETLNIIQTEAQFQII